MEAVVNKQDVGRNIPNKTTNLNPNASEFVPSSVGLLGGSRSNDAEIKNNDFFDTSWEPTQNFSASNGLNVYDHEYWSHQFPNDISPDFEITGEDDLCMPHDLSLSGLYIDDGIEASQFGTSGGSIDHTLASFTENAYCGDPNVDEGTSYDSMNHVDFLASQFPNYSAASLAELYFANGYDLNLTIEILAQLEIQVEVGSKQELQSKPSDRAVSLNPLDFPALPTSSDGNIGISKCIGDDTKVASDTYKLFDNGTFSLFNVSSTSASSRDVSDFASAVRKIPSRDFEHSKNTKNASTFTCANPIRNSQNSHSLYIGNGKSVGMDKMQNSRSTSRANASWLKTGDAVGNMYSESREEARDLARVRNAYFEQARLSYLVGNKALAKELSVKGQLYNMQMKAAHEKAREAIYKQRNPNSPVVQGKVVGKDPLIDLHGLHVNEAIHILKQEISMLRKKARSGGCPLQAQVCVGTGHHTKGSRTPARLPVAVERYLAEEGVEYSEPQPGLFRMVVK